MSNDGMKAPVPQEEAPRALTVREVIFILVFGAMLYAGVFFYVLGK